MNQDKAVVVQQTRDVSVDSNPDVTKGLPFDLTALSAFAARRPRDPAQAIDRAIAELEAMPEFAAKAYYVIPYDTKKGPVNVEGPSIKAATAITRAWGNCVEGGYVGEETEDRVKVYGYLIDLETGKITIRPVIVSKYRKIAGSSNTYKMRDDEVIRAIQAGISKAIRNADLNGVPQGLIEEYNATAKRIVAQGTKRSKAGAPPVPPAPAKERFDAMVTAFQEFNVTKEQIEQYIMKNMADKSLEEILAHMRGVYNSLSDDQAKPGEFFEGGGPNALAPKGGPVPPKGPMSMGDIVKDAK